MTEYIQAAQKERETWLSGLTDSNPIGARLASKIGGKSEGQPEMISDENVRLLCQKIKDDPELLPSEDGVQFLIVKILAGHIE